MALCWHNYLLLCIILVISSDAGLYTYRIAYAIWSGVGIVLISLLSWGFFGQRLDLPAIIGMMLICAGVLVINLLSRSAPH